MNYEIKYEPFPVLVMDLNNGETVQCQSGAMSWMTPNIEMQTSTGGGIGKLFGRRGLRKRSENLLKLKNRQWGPYLTPLPCSIGS
jgi:uncharacterized protein (AIM24 family)